MSAAIILTICGMRPSVFERLGLWMVEWFHLNGKQGNITKTGNLSQLCDLILRVSVDNYFFPAAIILTIWMRPQRLGCGWMVSFEWKTRKHHEKNLSQLCDLILRVSVDNYFFPLVNILKMLWRSYCEKISWPNS